MNKKSKNVKIEHSPRLLLTTRRKRCWCIIKDDHHGECDDEDVQCLAALPHSPLLAPTKCDRWGGNLGTPLPFLPPIPPLPSPFFPPSPSSLHTQNQFEKMEAGFCEEQWWIRQQLPHILIAKLPPQKKNYFWISILWGMNMWRAEKFTNLRLKSN